MADLQPEQCKACTAEILPDSEMIIVRQCNCVCHGDAQCSIVFMGSIANQMSTESQ